MKLNNAITQLTNQSYPLTRTDLQQDLQNTPVDLKNGQTVPFNTLLPNITHPITFHTQQDLELYLRCLVNDSCIGEKYYDDRGRTLSQTPPHFF